MLHPFEVREHMVFIVKIIPKVKSLLSLGFGTEVFNNATT